MNAQDPQAVEILVPGGIHDRLRTSGQTEDPTAGFLAAAALSALLHRFARRELMALIEHQEAGAEPSMVEVTTELLLGTLADVRPGQASHGRCVEDGFASVHWSVSVHADGGIALILTGPDDVVTAPIAEALRACAATFLLYAAEGMPLREIAVSTAAPSTPNARAVSAQQGLGTVGAAVHTLVEQQVLARPDACALYDACESLTYLELVERARQIAGTLVRVAVAPGDCIGVMLERSVDSVAALIAVSMAGATAVPLDPVYPQARLNQLLEMTGARVALARAEASERLRAHHGIKVLDIGACHWSGVEPVHKCISGTEVATVMFTSGSTGVPKGVQITHRGITRLVLDDRFVDFRDDDTVLHFAPAVFDACLLEIWGALGRGATLAIAPSGPTTLAELAAFVVDNGITVLWLTAGLFHQFAQFEPDALAGVRRMYTGGDVVAPAQVRFLLERYPGLEVVNGYGPTENTTFTCCHIMRGENAIPEAVVPIGRPVAETEVFIVDAYGQPLPDGVPGELWTAGAGLALGYLGRADLTAERFTAAEYGPLRGLRVYRTGDLARRRPDAVFEFLGRLDRQVKINGHRVEPGEVEAHLEALDAVGQACVLVERDPVGGKRLAAYLTSAGAEPEPPVQLRARLAERVPSYLVPARFQYVDAFPLTANGKVDRARLQAGTEQRKGTR